MANLEKELSKENHDSNKLKEQWKTINEKLKLVPMALESLMLPGKKKVIETEMDESDIKQILSKLKTALENNHLNNIEKCLLNIKNYPEKNQRTKELEISLQEECRDFHFDEALKILHQIWKCQSTN
ncbi:MAG: hypothetical protein PF447_07725 [Spirochaetaceae bacterium]|jgi:F0F1-type ATP synthase delta subunit|nr:hypothetical protein [Spirochaetaceae bacterium]